MKIFAAVLVAALAIAALAVVLDSPLLVLLSVFVVAWDVLGAFAVGLRAAQRQGVVVQYFALLAMALILAAFGVAAVVLGERGDAPGLVLLGVTLITSVVVGAVALAARNANRSS